MENSFDAARESKEPATPTVCQDTTNCGGAEKIWDEDRGLRLKRRVVVMLAAAAMPLAVWVLARFPGAVESVYTDRIGQYVGLALARVSSLVPFSLAETLMVVLVLSGVCAGTLAMYHVARGRRRFTNAILCGVLRLGAVAGGIIVIFYLAWGFNYARADLVQRMHWQAFAEKALAKPDADRLARLCEELVEAGNRAYADAFGCEDLGRPSAPALTMKEVDATVERAYVRVTERLHLHPMFAVSRGRAKPMLLSPLMSRLLIMGFYSPWTGEANYDREVPACRLPEVIAHEKAHQRGVTSEDEANFFAFLACTSSDEPYVRYAGILTAQRLLIPELGELDVERAKAIIAKRFKGVQRDADAVRAFIVAHSGIVSAAGRAVNNAYLKANRVKAGVKSYQLSARLILVYAEFNGGTCVPPGVAPVQVKPLE